MTQKDKNLILSIETSTNICSVCLSLDEDIVAYRENKEKNAHSRMLSIMIENLFKQTKYEIKDLKIVAISKGPGSYTGLRIGVSTAKGIAYGLDIPLISVDTLKILASACREKYSNYAYMPMIDARRMEVYCAIYDKELKEIKKISADIVDENLYDEYIKDNNIIIIGDGAEKCRDVLKNKRFVFDNEISLSASNMPKLVMEKLKNEQYEDVAYFEPYYLKQFIAVKSHVKGLYD